MPSEDRLDFLFRQRQAEVEERERDEREKAERKRERDRQRQQLATELQMRVGGTLAALVSQYSAPRYHKGRRSRLRRRRARMYFGHLQ